MKPLIIDFKVIRNDAIKIEIKFLVVKAMRKDFISGFSWFSKDEINFFSYSNLTQNKFGTFVFAKIL